MSAPREVCVLEVLPSTAPIAVRCQHRSCGKLHPYVPPKWEHGPIYLTENGAYAESDYRALVAQKEGA